MELIDASQNILNSSMRNYWENLRDAYIELSKKVESIQEFYNRLYSMGSQMIKHITQRYTGDRWLLEYALLGLNKNFRTFNSKFQKCIDKINREIDKIKVILSRQHFKRSFNFVGRFNEFVRYLNKVTEFVNTDQFMIDNVVLNSGVFLQPLNYL